MRTHTEIQGTENWLNLRAKHLTASEAPAMIGVSTYMSRTELLTLKKTGVANEIDAATQRRFDDGHKFEALARPFAEKIIGEDLYPVTGSIELDGLSLLASFDGLTMLEDIGWEHKTLNEKLREALSQDIIPEQYHPQLEQQLIVSGAEKILFMASDGTEDNMYHVWYESNPELRSKLLAGWGQFKTDLENHEPQIKEVAPVAKPIESLPALLIQLDGKVTNSNLEVYKTTALEFIDNINTELATDDDFIQAEAMVKFCGNAEKELEATKKQALAQTISIDEMFKTVDFLKEELRKKRLYLDKLVKSKKQEIKGNILKEADNKFNQHTISLNQELGGLYLPRIPPNFAGVIKGKRTISSIQNAVDTEMAQAKIEANEVASGIRKNLTYLESEATTFKFLFNDLQSIITKYQDDFKLLVDSRISNHKAEEEKRLEAERLRIRQEEERKAQVKIEAEQRRVEQEKDAEAKKIASEEREKRLNEMSEQSKDAVDATVQESKPKQENPINPDFEHQKKVNNDLVDLFMGLNVKTAETLVIRIVQEKIPHLTINY